MAPRKRAAWPSTRIPPQPPAPALSLGDRRARAAQRAWALMATTIPTRDILASYLDDILTGS